MEHATRIFSRGDALGTRTAKTKTEIVKMPKKPQPMTITAEGRLEGFGTLCRDFNVTLESNSSLPLTGGLVVARWADPGKPVERWVPEGGTMNHAFGPGPRTIVIYLESEDAYWGGVANVEGFSTLKISLSDKE